MSIARWLPRFRHAARAITELKDRESWPHEKVEAYQLQRINEVWAHAIEHVPYYIRLAREQRLPGRFDSLATFINTVPVLSKPQIRKRTTELLSDQARPGAWKFASGTTGRPTTSYWSHDAHKESLRAKYRFYSSWGVDVFDPTVFLWNTNSSVDPGLKGSWARFRQPHMDRLRNRLRLSALTLTKPTLRGYLEKIEAFKPVMIYGYSRALYLLAMEAEAVGFRCDSLKLIVATSEPAWPHMMECMERNLHAPVAREYGAQECGIIATDTLDRMLRIREDHVFVETLPRDDGQYDLVITVLTNPSFPLIRYAIGDLTDKPISRPDGGFAVLSSVAGRNMDMLRTRTGDHLHWVHIEMSTCKTIMGIARRFTIHQRMDGSVEVEVELDDPAKAEAAAPHLAALADDLCARLEGYPVSMRIVDSVQQTTAGKHRVVRSDLYNLNTDVTPEPIPTA